VIGQVAAILFGVYLVVRIHRQGNRLNRDEMPPGEEGCLRPGWRQWSGSSKRLTSPPFFV
jgi:hypothetical protein